MRTLVLSALLASSGCSTVLVSHVHGSDYKTPGVRYFLPAPYLLVRSAVEMSRTETLFSMSPIDKTVLRRVLPCDDGQTPCRPRAAVPPPPPIPTPGQPPLRPGTIPSSGPSGAQSDAEDSAAASTVGVVEAERIPQVGEREGGAPATAVVWLPDYCQQYAILETNHAGNQKVQIQLAEGWKLTALNTEINNTEVLQKMFDTVSSLAGTMTSATQKAATAGVQSATSALERRTQAGAQGGRTRLFRRTQITAFKPGLYPMLQYPLTDDAQPDCTKLPSFRPPKTPPSRASSGPRSSPRQKLPPPSSPRPSIPAARPVPCARLFTDRLHEVC